MRESQTLKQLLLPGGNLLSPQTVDPGVEMYVIVKNIMLKGTGFAFIWKETLILLGMTLFFILASVKRFKIRLN